MPTILSDTKHITGLAVLSKKLSQLTTLQEGKILKSSSKFAMAAALKRARVNIPVGGKVGRSGRVTVSHLTYDGKRVQAGFAKSQLRTAAFVNKEGTIGGALLTTTKQAFYAINFVELGTRYQLPQPWIRKSLLEARSDVEDRLASKIAEGINKIAKS